ncbi:hypothetical protein AMS68_007800 [Peltaster fructicola]|uniref:Alpha-methylacyl-CoA racemase n=1 Tax=Peltaster fructicola TaxID=286661 RepID=A0A6H0Y5K7_9PEZI|nr:hypothetical protein AMS68_007800 [Peltaster fructicola]
MLLADFGATVLRADRAHPAAHSSKPPPPTPDFQARRKSSIAVNLKSAEGLELIKALIPTVDIVIDPFRPGVLEKAGLDPENVLLKLNPRLIVARMTGFRRDGKYKDMAGHDINYIAVSGVLSMLGRANDKPYAPGNIVGDFAGGGAVCFLGILLALLQRERSGRGQVVEANMVDGGSYMATFLRLARATPMWNDTRGHNVLDGGCPYYDTYETKDGQYMAVGALEPQFFAVLLKGLDISASQLEGRREDKSTWSGMRTLFTAKFKEKTRAEWEAIFDGTDACCTPVLDHDELEEAGHDQRPVVTLKDTPGYALAQKDASGRPPAEGQGSGIDGEGWRTMGLRPGVGGEDVLTQWLGWTRGHQYEVKNGGLVLRADTEKSKL